MININNKSWDKLRFKDVEKLLLGADDENFFFEFKSDDESPAKLTKEISAFSNTYGGYIFLGINDDKTIGGCKNWTEQRIHVTIHDSITPIPNFDVKKFKHEKKVIFIIKIEEGTMPPYVTNKGQIFERVSSGSFPIKESYKIGQLYNKRIEQLNKVKNKIEIPPISIDVNLPNNVCGYIDMGFSVVCSERTELDKNFYKMDFGVISKYLKKLKTEYSISRLADSYIISIGRLRRQDSNGQEHMLKEGIHNFIEIMSDGSMKCRLILSTIPDDYRADITYIGYLICVIFKKIYSMMLGDNYANIFVYAQKYERLTVLQQFVPYYKLGDNESDEDRKAFSEYLTLHKNKYGNNIIITSDRFPKNDYRIIDKRKFTLNKVKYNTENLIQELFSSIYVNLGYIDDVVQ